MGWAALGLDQQTDDSTQRELRNAVQMCYSVLLNTPLRNLYDRASEVGSSAV